MEAPSPSRCAATYTVTVNVTANLAVILLNLSISHIPHLKTSLLVQKVHKKPKVLCHILIFVCWLAETSIIVIYQNPNHVIACKEVEDPTGSPRGSIFFDRRY